MNHLLIDTPMAAIRGLYHIEPRLIDASPTTAGGDGRGRMNISYAVDS